MNFLNQSKINAFAFFILSLSLCASSRADTNCNAMLGLKLQKLVNKKSFTRNRDFLDYQNAFGWFLNDFLDKNKNAAKICYFDPGGGVGKAATEIVQNHENISALVVDYGDKSALRSESLGGRVVIWPDRLLEDIPDSELGTFDLITDVYGPFAYSDQWNLVLEIYLNHLNPNGEILLFLGEEGDLILKNMIIDTDGVAVDFEQWLKNQPNLELTWNRHLLGGIFGGEGVAVRIKKTTSAPIHFSKLESLVYTPSIIPARIMREAMVSSDLIQKQFLKNVQSRFTSSMKQVLLNSTQEYFFGIEPLLKGLKANQVWTDLSFDHQFQKNWIFGKTALKDPKRFQSLSNLPPESIDLITDLMGRYLSDNPVKILNEYIRLLKVKGSIVIGSEFLNFAKVIDKEGYLEDFSAWLKRALPKSEISIETNFNSGIGQMVLKKKKTTTFQSPEVEFVGLQKNIDENAGRFPTDPIFKVAY